jgi:hypothetical protein
MVDLLAESKSLDPVVLFNFKTAYIVDGCGIDIGLDCK